MTAQETKLFNAFETTLTATAGASDLTFTVNNLTLPGPDVTAPLYVVINPDSSTNREVIHITSLNAGTKTLTCDNINKRFLAGSAATSGLSHASGSVVRMSPLQQHIEDLNDRVDTVINEAGTAVNTTLFLDEDNMSSNSATKGVTQQSVKAYVDTSVTAQDLDISADSGSNIAIDLDSEVLDIEGGTGIGTTTGTNKVTLAIDSTVTTLVGTQVLTNKTLTSPVLNTGATGTAIKDEDNMASNSATHLATQQSIKAYVDTNVTAQDLDTAGNSGTGSVDLDSQSLTVSGDGTILSSTASGLGITFAIADATTSAKGAASFASANFAVSSGAVTIKDGGVANAELVNSSITVSDGSNTSPVLLGGTLTFAGTSSEVEVAESSGTVTIGLPATINANTTGSAATLTTARTIGGVSFNGSANINLPGVNAAGNQNTSGTAAGLSATLVVASGGTGLASYTAGDLLYYASGTTLTKLAKGSANQVLAMNSGASAPEWVAASPPGDITNVIAGVGLSGGGETGEVTLTLDLSELSAVTPVNGDSFATLDSDGASEQRTTTTALATLFSGTGLTASNSVIGVDASQAITALTGGDLTIYEDANNADVSVKMGTSATESLTIEVLNGASNKTAEQINFTTATASGTTDHGKMVFAVDATTVATIDDGGIDLASGLEFSVNGTAIGGSAGALIVGDSDFTLSDGIANGIHYELDNTDMADWNAGGIALSTAGGIFRHNQTQAATYTVAATEGSVMAGPITITGTVTNAGTMVIL